MTKYFSCLVLLLIAIMLLFGIENISRCKETERLLQIQKFECDQEIEELKKENRLLKTDISILREGFENE
jgi:cell division protein FtsB